MQRLLAFQRNQGKRIALAFIDSQVFIQIATGEDRFEPPSIWPRTVKLDLKQMERYLADLRLAKQVAADLNLNLRIWGKQ